ncbi:MAG: hypothetical protein ACJ8DJ_06910 [Gemmatimonadales bacterium]
MVPVLRGEPLRYQAGQGEDLRGRGGREIEQGSQDRTLVAGSAASARLLDDNELGDCSATGAAGRLAGWEGAWRIIRAP